VKYIATLRAQLDSIAVGFVAALPGIAIALVILLITWIIARFAARIADVIVGRSDMRLSLKALLDAVVRAAIWIVGVMLAAIVVMPSLTPASLFAGIGIAALAVGFAFHGILENFLAGVLIMVRREMQIGDVIVCGDVCGRVELITVRESHIRALTNELIIIPNSILFKHPVSILTDEDVRRHELEVSVANSTDLDRAADVIRRAVEKVASINSTHGVEVLAHRFGDGAVAFLVRWWSASTPKASNESRDQTVRAIKRALDVAGIDMTGSFPAKGLGRSTLPNRSA
jgi:small-conductance mechanosensitive channel